MYCSKCGVELTPDSKFCNRCGSPVENSAQEKGAENSQIVQLASSSSPIKQAVPETSSHLACPVCNRDDRVMKVSSIVSGGTHEISGGGYTTQTYVDSKGKTRYDSHYVPMSGTQQSALAGQLSPPPKPETGWNTCGLIVLASGVWFGIWAMLLFGFTSGNAIPGLVLIGIGITVYVLTEMSRQGKVNQIEQVEVPKWEKAIQRWNKLYYCHRDDVLFVPEEGIAISKSQMYQYLYQ